MKKKCLMWLLLTTILSASCLLVNAQAKLVINGGIIIITNGAYLVIENPDNTAITRTNAGYIITEGAENKIAWAIGAGNGNTYLLPFGNAAGYFPLHFEAASGTGNGCFIFSTFPTGGWKNSDKLPPGVANVNKDGKDNSAKMIDRFWEIAPQNYTKNPALTNLLFTYTAAELAAPNTITAANLAAQRWDSTLRDWNNYKPSSLVNTANNTLTVAAVESNQLYNWWTLSDLTVTVNVAIANFKAAANNGHVITTWQTLAEQNVDHFEVWRSKDGVQFESAGTVVSAGNNAGISTYSFTDAGAYTGTSYYQLKTIDKNGGFKLSAIVPVTIDLAAGIFLSPNPAVNAIIINSSVAIINSKPIARLYDDKGGLLQTIVLTSTSQQVNIAGLSAGIYQLSITYSNEVKTIRFIKN